MKHGFLSFLLLIKFAFSATITCVLLLSYKQQTAYDKQQYSYIFMITIAALIIDCIVYLLLGFFVYDTKKTDKRLDRLEKLVDNKSDINHLKDE